MSLLDLLRQRAEQAGKKLQVMCNRALRCSCRSCAAAWLTPRPQVHRAVVVFSLKPGAKDAGECQCAA